MLALSKDIESDRGKWQRLENVLTASDYSVSMAPPEVGTLENGPASKLKVVVERKVRDSEVDLHTRDDWHKLVAQIALAVMSLLLPYLSRDEAPPLPDGDTEGGAHEVTATRYERSPENRAACIVLHGTRCCVCGISMEEVYGSVGQGYIQVHHLQPVAQAGMHVVDPSKDLVPLCPNCHAMIHRRTPPLTPEELRSQMLSSGQDA
ncbi:MAG: HNH endonuclease [Anaerolineae bacterium]